MEASANAEGGLGMTSAALDLSRQLSGIAEEVVIAGTIHVACFCTLILEWLLLIWNAEYVECRNSSAYLMEENCPEVPLVLAS